MAEYVLPRGVQTLAGVADTNNVIINDGDQDVTAGLAQNGLTEGLAGLRVGRKSSVRIGGASARLQVDLDSGAGALIDYNAGGGHLYYEPKGDNNLCHLIYQRGMGYLDIGGGGTVTELNASSSKTKVAEATILTTLRMRNTAVVEIGYHATVITAGYLSGPCNLTCARVFTTLNIYGAGIDKTRVVIRRENFTASTTPVPVNVYCQNATLVMEVAGTTTLLDAYESYVDLSGIPGSLTFTNSNFDAETYKRSRLKSMFGASVVYTNPASIKFGPEDA